MHHETLDIQTSSRDDMQDITSEVRKVVRDSGIKHGMVTIYVPHTTAAVTINENADPDVIHDVLAQLDTMIPWNQNFYQHGEGNSAAHVKSSLVGCTSRVPLIDGSLTLGTWQSVFFCDFDGPRRRRYIVTIQE